MDAFKGTHAIRSNKILLMAHDLKEGPACAVGMAYMAKFLYPERFLDLDPALIAREYYQKWCRLPYRGVHLYPPIGAGSAVWEVAKKESFRSRLAIIDGVGRRVDVPLPLKRIVAANGTYGPEMLCSFGVSDRIVGITDHAAMPKLHLSAFLRNIPALGKTRQINTEKVIELAPDAVLLYETFYPYMRAFTDNLDRAGIKMIVMDFHRPEVFDQRIRLMGTLLGKQKRAEELIAFEQKQFGRIKNRLKKIPVSKLPRVYLESYLDYTTVTPKNPDHKLLKTCGGTNIFHDLNLADSLSVTVAPEAVIERNPDVIIKHISTNHVLNSGYGAKDPNGLAQVRAAIMRRPGWQNVSAIKSGRVYILDTGTKATHPSIYCAYIAKWLHPGRFEDLDPEAVYRQWMQQFLGLAFKGIYAYP
jgi:iron complex transport system substrate-binding protein